MLAPAGQLHAQAIDQAFEIEDIRVDGLQKLSSGTVFNYLPLQVGDRVDPASAREAIRALFKTGLFKDVQLDQQGNVLVVTVIERPSIAQIDVIGNQEFEDEQLKDGMTQSGFATGRIFNQSEMDRVIQDLNALYLSRGYYAVDIQSTVTPLERNRVAVTLDVIEGEIAKIRQINVVGNEAFTDEELLDEFGLGERNGVRFWSRKDRYSKQKLEADLEALRSFYQDRGYLDFLIDSTQVSVTPDKRDVFISIAISEGERFTVSDIEITGDAEALESELVPGEDSDDKERLTTEEMIDIQAGEVFSRKKISKARAALRDKLADQGYAFSNVNAVPEINKENKTVSFKFVVDPGRRVQVRRINISGNSVTRDEVIRRELRQIEGGWYSESAIRRSRVRLQKLGYFDDVQIETPAVPGTIDQIDLDVSVSERATGSFLFGVGYSDADGVLFQANVNQRNLFGTGNELGVSYDNSDVNEVLDLRFKNPYHTIDGVSRGFSITQRKVDSSEAQTAVSEFTSFGWGVAYEQIDLEETPETPPEFTSFIRAFPTSDNFKLTSNLTRDTRDDFFFPSEGGLLRLGVEASIPGSDLEYYKVSARGSWFKSLTSRYVLKAGVEVGYGGGFGDSEDLPFFKNFFAGGPNTVRGFDSRSLGPRDSGDTPQTIGGSTRVLGNVELVFPLPGADSTDDKRLSLFMDAGQVFGPDYSVDFGEIRVSAGLAFSWFSPVGPFSISYGIPVSKEEGQSQVGCDALTLRVNWPVAVS